MISWTKQKHSLVNVPSRIALASAYQLPLHSHSEEGRGEAPAGGQGENLSRPRSGPHRSREPIWWRCLTQASSCLAWVAWVAWENSRHVSHVKAAWPRTRKEEGA